MYDVKIDALLRTVRNPSAVISEKTKTSSDGAKDQHIDDDWCCCWCWSFERSSSYFQNRQFPRDQTEHEGISFFCQGSLFDTLRWHLSLQKLTNCKSWPSLGWWGCFLHGIHSGEQQVQNWNLPLWSSRTMRSNGVSMSQVLAVEIYKSILIQI